MIFTKSTDRDVIEVWKSVLEFIFVNNLIHLTLEHWTTIRNTKGDTQHFVKSTTCLKGCIRNVFLANRDLVVSRTQVKSGKMAVL